MPRTASVAPGSFVYHVLNRSVGMMHMFHKESDVEAFERVMVDAHLRQPSRILLYCVLITRILRSGQIHSQTRVPVLSTKSGARTQSPQVS